MAHLRSLYRRPLLTLIALLTIAAGMAAPPRSPLSASARLQLSESRHTAHHSTHAAQPDTVDLWLTLAENAHDVWAAARKREGWTYGPVRDDQKKQHPDLIPYSALPDSEKEYDRLMALDTIKLVMKLGFGIAKK